MSAGPKCAGGLSGREPIEVLIQANPGPWILVLKELSRQRRRRPKLSELRSRFTAFGVVPKANELD